MVRLARAPCDMPLRIEDYGIIGDTQTAALVGRDGSVDWLCLPRFDSDACFAALLGDPSHGRWRIAPDGAGRSSRRRYRPDTLVLETEFDAPDGTVRLVDFMPPRDTAPDLMRVVQGLRCLDDQFRRLPTPVSHAAGGRMR